VTTGAQHGIEGVGQPGAGGRANIDASFLGLEQPCQLAQTYLRRRRHAFEKLRHQVEPDAQAEPVMIEYRRRPTGQGDRPVRGFFAPQARRHEISRRIMGLDTGTVEPVARGTAGAD
jgi:hypothetical protein